MRERSMELSGKRGGAGRIVGVAVVEIAPLKLSV
jgi:hypothetical protein